MFFLNRFKAMATANVKFAERFLMHEVKEKKNVTLLTHEVNKGKGEALKTAFRYLKSLNEKMIISTIDSDGQHSVKDIARCIKFYKTINEGLLLGSRMF